MSTFRADLVAHLVTVAAAYKVAHPTLLRKVWTARPGTFGGDVPLVFMGRRTETSPDDDTGTATREITVEVVVVDVFGDNEQLSDRMDVVVDGLATAYRSATNVNVSGGVIDRVGNVDDGDIEQPGTDLRPPVLYRAATLLVTAHIQEGRS